MCTHGKKNCRGFIIAFCLTCIFILNSCDTFAPRDPQDPAQSGQWNVYFTTAQLCVQNLAWAYQYNQNVQKYGELMASDFAFYFDEQDINDLNISNSPWGQSYESDMLTNLFNQLGTDGEITITLEPSPDHDDIELNDYARLWRNYTIDLSWTPEGVPTHYRGRCELYLVPDESNGFWRIQTWHDYRTSGQPSWGRLKYEFR